MLFSVVIPCHDRLDLLKDAIHTVVNQAYPHWELVVFDNASTPPLGEYVCSLGDKRIRCERSEAFLPVTKSWNRAIDLAQGDYVTILGDDDGLTPDYFARVTELVEEFDGPDLIYGALYQFFHPGVAPWDPDGYVIDLRNGFFFAGHDTPFVLSPRQARVAVSGSLILRRNFTFNMQAFVFRRTFLAKHRVKGGVFHSPFPDYYLANMAIALSERTVVDPKPLAIAGVSKASFGYTLFNRLEEKGAALLNTQLGSDPIFQRLEANLLPGPAYNTNYIVTMAYVADHLGVRSPAQPNFERYRKLQILDCLASQDRTNWRLKLDSRGLYDRMTLREKLWAFGVEKLRGDSPETGGWRSRVRKSIAARVAPYAFTPESRPVDKGRFSRLEQLFDALQTSAPSRG